MGKYLIPPEDCLIVLAFKNTSIIREAALDLKCDPGGLLRKVHRIAQEYQALEKIRGHWQLTQKGMDIITWVEDSIQSQAGLFSNQSRVRISSTTWLSEQVIIPNLVQLKKDLKGKSDFQIMVPNHGLEKDILMGSTDFAIACHAPNDPSIAHKKISKEEHSLIVPWAWQKEIKNLSDLEIGDFLIERTYVRHSALNPDGILEMFASKKIISEICVDHMVGVRASVVSGIGWSIVPSLLVREALKNDHVVSVKNGIYLDTSICLWWRRENREAKKRMDVIAGWLKESCFSK